MSDVMETTHGNDFRLSLTSVLCHASRVIYLIRIRPAETMAFGLSAMPRPEALLEMRSVVRPLTGKAVVHFR
jgi:hypothetical protein